MGTEKGFHSSEGEDNEDAETSYNLFRRKELLDHAERLYHDEIIRARDDRGWTFREIAEVVDQAPSWVFKLYHRRKLARGGSKAYPKGPPRSAT